MHKSIASFLIFVGLLFLSGSVKAQEGMTVAFLDVGQGDATYIEAPNGNQMIIDGGPRGSLLEPLSKVMPFGDTSIDVLVVTNPDADHFAGFIELLERYHIGAVIESGTVSETETYRRFETLLEEKNIPRVLAREGMSVLLDENREVVFKVLFPDRDVSSWSRNDGSIVGVLSWGSSDILFMGDSTIKTERMLGPLPDVEILKVGHHGSKTSTSLELLIASKPEYAIISLGEKNTYGHPHEEVLTRLANKKVLRTDILGTIEFEVFPTEIFE